MSPRTSAICGILVSNIFSLPGSISVRTGSWWSCPNWRRQVKASARSFWSRRSDNAASSSTLFRTPSPTWNGRRWREPRCRRWWSTSPRTGGCLPSLSIPRWGEYLGLFISSANVTLFCKVQSANWFVEAMPLFQVVHMFSVNLFRALPPTNNPSVSSENIEKTSGSWTGKLSVLKLLLCRVLNLTQKRMSRPWRLLGRTCNLFMNSSSGTTSIVILSITSVIILIFLVSLIALQVSWVFRFPTKPSQEIYWPAVCHGGAQIKSICSLPSGTMMLFSPAFGPVWLRRPTREGFPQNNPSQNLWQVLWILRNYWWSWFQASSLAFVLTSGNKSTTSSTTSSTRQKDTTGWQSC